MKVFAILFLSVLTCGFALAADINVEVLRKKFYSAVDCSATAKAFLEELELSALKGEPIVMGYKAAVNMVMAKHVFNPYSKFRYFIDGKKELEESIRLSPDNIELRLIRFAIQNNAPFFLGYNGNIKDDKAFMIKNMSKLNMLQQADRQLKQYITDYLLASKHCTKEELASISKPDPS